MRKKKLGMKCTFNGEVPEFGAPLLQRYPMVRGKQVRNYMGRLSVYGDSGEGGVNERVVR